MEDTNQLVTTIDIQRKESPPFISMVVKNLHKTCCMGIKILHKSCSETHELESEAHMSHLRDGVDQVWCKQAGAQRGERGLGDSGFTDHSTYVYSHLSPIHTHLCMHSHDHSTTHANTQTHITGEGGLYYRWGSNNISDSKWGIGLTDGFFLLLLLGWLDTKWGHKGQKPNKANKQNSRARHRMWGGHVFKNRK